MSHAIRPAARLWAVLLLVWAVALAAHAQAPGAAPGVIPLGVIDANAKIHVVVANEAELTGDYTVDQDGNVTLLYVNQVHVQGLTPAQAAALIKGAPASGGKKATGLTQFYVNPQVVVTIVDPGGVGVDVTGLVSAPRHYVVRSDAHLNDVLQQAVPALNADLSKVEITHAGTGNKDTVNYRAYVDNKAADGNPALHNGDVVNVASRDPQPITVSVQGQVAKPGRFEVPAASTAYSAVQAAGGPTPAANTAGVVLKHFGAGPTDTIPFSYEKAGQTPTDPAVNPVLQDGDTIIVPAAPITQSYTLTGAGVRNPAEYPLTDGRPITLAAAIGKAGGLADRAKLGEVQIIRTNPTTQTIKLNASDPNVQATYLIQAGDNVTINQGSPHSSIDPLQAIGILIAVLGILR